LPAATATPQRDQVLAYTVKNDSVEQVPVTTKRTISRITPGDAPDKKLDPRAAAPEPQPSAAPVRRDELSEFSDGSPLAEPGPSPAGDDHVVGPEDDEYAEEALPKEGEPTPQKHHLDVENLLPLGVISLVLLIIAIRYFPGELLPRRFLRPGRGR